MAKKKTKTGGNQPDVRIKEGVFQLSGWKTKKVIPAKNDFDVERTFERVNICLSVGMKQNGKWNNVQAWFGRSQFGDLKAAVDEFAEELRKINGVNAESGQQ